MKRVTLGIILFAIIILAHLKSFSQSAVTDVQIYKAPTSLVLNGFDTIYNYGLNFKIADTSDVSFVLKVGTDSTSQNIFYNEFFLHQVNGLPQIITYSRVADSINIYLGQYLPNIYYFQIAAKDTLNNWSPFIIKSTEE